MAILCRLSANHLHYPTRSANLSPFQSSAILDVQLFPLSSNGLHVFSDVESLQALALETTSSRPSKAILFEVPKPIFSPCWMPKRRAPPAEWTFQKARIQLILSLTPYLIYYLAPCRVARQLFLCACRKGFDFCCCALWTIVRLWPDVQLV